MGWHYILHLRCVLLPEYVDFMKEKKLSYFSIIDENIGISGKMCDWVWEEVQEEENDSEKVRQEKRAHNQHIQEVRASMKMQIDEQEVAYHALSKTFQDLVDIWRLLDIDHFYQYSVKEGVFSCEISIKVTEYEGDLRKAYETFLKDVIVPMTSEILTCVIESDDFGDARYVYSDAELRNVMFSLRDMIKVVEHTYNEDRSEILESRVVYKRSIPRRLFLDLNRAYRHHW